MAEVETMPQVEAAANNNAAVEEVKASAPDAPEAEPTPSPSVNPKQMEQIKELWDLYNAKEGGGNPGNPEGGKPPFLFFNPMMYSEEYQKRMEVLMKKKATKERKNNKKANKNVESSFKTEGKDDTYDIDKILKSLGEVTVNNNNNNVSKKSSSSKKNKKAGKSPVSPASASDEN